MSTNDYHLEPETILEDQGFLQRLARGLVRDEHSADDLVQQAWVAALEHPPRDRGPLRSWLARVTRNLAINLARRETRRTEREQRVARNESLPPADEMEMQLELQRLVVEAVQQLDEPYKSAVFLRYYQELSPDEIAERLSLPVATVKTRLRRALASLRERLDRKFGGDRRAWSIAILPIAAKGVPHAATAAHGGFVLGRTSDVLLVGTKSKLTIATLLVLGLTLCVWRPWSTNDLESAALVSGNTQRETDSVSVDRERTDKDLTAGTEIRTESRESLREPRGPRAPNDEDLVFHGRVVDSHRFSVSGAEVTLLLPGLVQARTRSDERGEFRFDGGKRPIGGVRPVDGNWSGGVRAFDDKGRVAVRWCRISSRENLAAARTDWLGSMEDPGLDLGALVLEDSYSVRARILDHGQPVIGAKVFAEWDTRRIACLETDSDANGIAELRGLPAGPMQVRATVPGKEGRKWTYLSMPEADPMDVELVANHSIDVSVVDAVTGVGIPGVHLSIDEPVIVSSNLGLDEPFMNGDFQMYPPSHLSIEPTDANGHRLIEGLPSLAASIVRCTAAGFREEKATTIAPGTFEVRIGMRKSAPPRTVRWPIEAGPCAIPADGTTLHVKPSTLPKSFDEPIRLESSRVENGHVVVEGLEDPAHELLAETPDGSIARLWVTGAELEEKPASFRAGRKIDVLVRDRRGSVAQGARVQARDPGGSRLNDYVPTGADGHALLRGLFSGRATVYVLAALQPGFGEPAGIVDLDKGDGKIEYTLPYSVDVCMRVHSNGRVFLPSKFVVRCDSIVTLGREDPEKGYVFFSLMMPADASEVPLMVSSAGYSAVKANVVATQDTKPFVLDVELVPSANVVARVQRPNRQSLELYLETWNTEQKRWNTVAGLNRRGMREPNGPGGTFRFEDCSPGRYRVRDELTKVTSSAVDLETGMHDVEVALDLAPSCRIQGFVETPEGTDFSKVRVLAEGEGIGANESGEFRGHEMPNGERIDQSGAFKLIVPSDRRVRLRAWHPFLVPAPDGGSETVEGPRDDVRLRLVAGDEIRIPVPKDVLDWHEQGLRVYQYAGEPSGQPVACFHAPIADGVARFAGIAPGQWTLWIDPWWKYAPVALNVQVAQGITVVDWPKLSLGSSVRVNVLVGAGDPPPRIYVNAKSRGEPSYYRGINSGGEAIVVLTGLARGVFDVHVKSIMDGKQLPDRTVEVDGVNDVDLTVDLR
jgi:RNA polymerase sigma-70 factor (ECF subfamily)